MRIKLILFALFVTSAALANPFVVGLLGDGATGGSSGGGSGSQCADVVFSPAGANTSNVTVTLTTATSGATIFYRSSSTIPKDPVHAGGVATSPTKIYTVPFSSGSGTVSIRAVAYKSGLSDGNITEGDYGP